MRSKMGGLDAFDNEVPMLRNISAPFLKAFDDKLEVGISRDTLRRMKRFHREKTFFVSKWLHQEAKTGEFLNP